jgi:hypothetical protein
VPGLLAEGNMVVRTFGKCGLPNASSGKRTHRDDAPQVLFVFDDDGQKGRTVAFELSFADTGHVGHLGA